MTKIQTDSLGAISEPIAQHLLEQLWAAGLRPEFEYEMPQCEGDIELRDADQMSTDFPSLVHSSGLIAYLTYAEFRRAFVGGYSTRLHIFYEAMLRNGITKDHVERWRDRTICRPGNYGSHRELRCQALTRRGTQCANSCGGFVSRPDDPVLERIHLCFVHTHRTMNVETV